MSSWRKACAFLQDIFLSLFDLGYLYALFLVIANCSGMKRYGESIECGL